ncbi:hypothetical protein COX00_00125 [Candidatus Uhrbacteria bacterium CG22_combo_CG10-13_8_21_14_all_47_17]|uniref:Uncharacterized protein n=1 Tax=Candidatus Uhrbacteria bacterium CG22_combo_CG10-13_8_21_14_all_47_17 TaxID=1975041 RepID=A0A2H0BTJ9_9BACT|nr:MAG: hypothetical protein COX00_00125 [Candidatus Uhrbacteria bacterium CG22_combo_CG10-13_8_21_14_all_47_17]
MKDNANKLGLAGALTAAFFMLVLSLLNSVGLYQGATQQMRAWHMWYTPNFGGTITGMIEAAVITYIVLFVFTSVYNLLEKKA